MSEENHLPLEGIKVLDMGNWIAGPAAATVMSDFGADVIKIEPLGIGDQYRHINGAKGTMHSAKDNYPWILTSRNKRSLAMDIKNPDGYAALLKLVEQADIVVTNFRPALLKKLKVDYGHLSVCNPRLIFGHMTGFGQKGAEANDVAFDRTSWWARSGLMDFMRPSGEPTRTSTVGIGDNAAAMSLFGGVMMALHQRHQTGRGREVHTSLVANGTWSNGLTLQATLAGGALQRLDSTFDTGNAFGVAFCSADDRWFSFWIHDPIEGPSVVSALIDEPAILQDQRFTTSEAIRENAQALYDIVQNKISQKNFAEWKHGMDELEIRFVLAASQEEVINDPQLLVNGLFPDLENPGGIAQKTIDSPITLCGVNKVKPRMAPELGQHSIEILKEYGLSDDTIAALVEKGIVTI
jgi:crotonobetainyl-CoA:carnitine CoA-transferase CaiB-like acyl-CoA transferase